MTLQNIKISLRSDSLENWISSDPVLKNGELVMVNDISAGLVRFKIGNGVSAFMQLPYVNEKKVITDFAKAKRTESQYFSQGVNNFVSPLGFAAGNYITADSSFAQVLGINACSPEGHDYSFVWNGDSSGTIGVQSYRSHGEGTFNVNPVSGVNGFYIGNKTLSGILSSACQPKGNYLSSNALNGYRTYDNTVTSLTAQSGFKTYADAKSSLSSDGYATQAQLDAKSSISVDNQRADVNILHISQEEYDQLVVRNEVLSNFVYVVSGDYVNAYEQQIKNLAPGTDISDAVNLQQLQAAVESVPLSDYYTKTQTDHKLAEKAGKTALETHTENKSNPHGVTAAQVSALPLSGGTITGQLNIDDAGVFLKGQAASLHVWGDGQVTGVDITGDGIAIKGKPVTTKAYVDDNLSTKQDSLPTLAGQAGVYGISTQYALSANSATTSNTAISVQWSGVQNKPIASATELGLVKIGNNLTIDADGTLNATGSGGGSTEGIRYKLITKTLQEGTYNGQSVLTCQIDDRATTTIVVGSSEKDVVLYLPPKPDDGGARDFIIRVEVTASTAPGFYFIGASETINYDSDDEDWSVLEPGLNLISFTETK